MKKKKGRILEENNNTYTEKDKEQYEEKREKEERVRESKGKTNIIRDDCWLRKQLFVLFKQTKRVTQQS